MSTDQGVAGVSIPRAGKIMYPGPELSKQDVAEYYAAMAPVMLPHLRGRPVTMQRFPDGVDADAFYEKRLPEHFPGWVTAVEVQTADGPQAQVMIDSTETLVYLAGQACLTPHTWLSRSEALDRPDQMIFDVDPSRDDLALVRRATRAVRDALESLGLSTWLKTTGSRGYHLTVPLRPEHDFDAVRSVARSIAEQVVESDPDSFTIEQRKGNRGDRVFIDWLRNGYGQTAVPPYALRGRPEATVATPIEWDELSRVAPDHFTHASVRRRLAQRDDPWQDLDQHPQRLDPVIEQLDLAI